MHSWPIDPDDVDSTNLSRLPEARIRDATGPLGTVVGRIARKMGLNRPTAKVALARRVVLGANPRAKLETVRGDVVDDAVARRLLGCDFIFLAADTMLARNVVLTKSPYQYLVPTTSNSGSKVVQSNRKTRTTC